jgi:hypothetical protein
LQELNFGQFLVVVVLAAAGATLVFGHADRHGNKHATAWGVATFLALGIALPLYFIRYWLRARAGRRS